MARVKIVLRQDVESLGTAGDVVTVAGGFARNYLIPRGMALPATKGNLKQAESWQKGSSTKEAREVAVLEELKTKLESAPIPVSAKSGPDGQLFGSITPAQIAESAKQNLGVDVDRHVIQLAAPIRHLGFHQVTAKLGREVVATLTVEALEAQ
ncbi:MAG TPA: 50S ribosomal protein L9 [Actinomycetota bacterium]|nr:50S ribosomal protein L9 [Actinomycetota bacterium]